MPRKILLLFSFALLLSWITTASAFVQREEHIRSFASIITVNRNASIHVTEHLQVFASGNEIKHGLVRWLPAHFTDTYGVSHQVHYDILKILVNNRPFPYHLVLNDNSLAIYIGDKNKLLEPGNYEFTLSYHVDDAVNSLKDGDELYWNVTGNNWSFPIMNTIATIYLPEGAVIQHHYAYTGKAGEKGTDFVVAQPLSHMIIFTAGYLSPGQGLTVAIAWPKGIITPLTYFEKFKRSFINNHGPLLIFEVALVLALYYLLVWYWFGRDPKRGTIIPLFEPPQNLSPAALRFIWRMGFDVKAFAAAIISLASKQCISIENTNGEFTLKKIFTADYKDLAPEEEKIVSKLFANNPTLTCDNDNSTVIRAARHSLKESLIKQFQDVYFRTNAIYLIPGILFTLVSFVAAIITANDMEGAMFAVIWLSAWTIGCTLLLMQTYTCWQHAIAAPAFTTIAGSLFMLLFSVPFFIGEVLGIFMLTPMISIYIAPILFFNVSLNFIFYYLMKVPTVQGRRLMDQIDGFKLYLGTTERYRLEQLNPPEQTPELFEKYLPYAIALNVENAWGQQFNDSSYRPSWYRGTWLNHSAMSFPSFLGAILGSRLSSASDSSVRNNLES